MSNTNIRKLKRISLDNQIEHFEAQNPKVVNAMRLFDMSLAEYQSVMNVMQQPRVATTNHTTSIASPERYGR